MAISLPLLDPDNDLEVYFRHFEIEDDDSLTFAFLQRFASDFLKHKIHVQKYLNKMSSSHRSLLKKLKHIYFHPETNMICTLILANEFQTRRHLFILYHLCQRHIYQVYPSGDNHYNDFQAFLSTQS